MQSSAKSLIVLLGITLFSTLAVWFGFYKNIPEKLGFPATSLETVFANYDGPNYMVIAKCGYDKSCIGPNFSLPQPLEYYPAHFPGYPALISFMGWFTSTPKAMLISTLIGSLLLTWITHKFFLLYCDLKTSFWLTMFSVFFPARLFTLRLVGAPETWFLFLTMASIVTFKKQKYLLSGLAAALAIMFKSPGVILAIAYLIVAMSEVREPEFLKKYLPFLFCPLSVLAIFAYYQNQIGDFWAYFHSGDNIHLYPLPFMVFISNRSWINTIWLEDVIYIITIAFYGISRLFKNYKFDIVSVYPALFTFATLFVAHRDISRYLAPVYIFLILAFAKLLTTKKSKIIFGLLLPAVILFAINFLIGNTAPISNWTPYL